MLDTVMSFTKIVATIGPSSQSKKQLEPLVRAGVSIARLNMSHGDHEYHGETVKNVRVVEKLVQRPLAVLVDLAGPKIRIGDFETSEIELIPGKEFILSIEKVAGTEKKVYINYPAIVKEVKKGMVILLDDGKKALEVTKVTQKEVFTVVKTGGIIKPRRGVNIPGARLSIKTLTEKDEKDVAWAIENKADFIALSFVRSVKDIEELRTLIVKKKGTQKIIAKIETVEALENIENIIQASDAVMVARGDLAIEVGPEKVPHEQKNMIELARMHAKPIITATQMLESMTTRPVPSRAEVSDVANAVFDGTDAVMLSEETAMGQYPLETIEVMSRVLNEAEKDEYVRAVSVDHTTIQNAITSAVAQVALDTDAKAIIALTETGGTAKLVSRYRIGTPIVAVTPYIETARQLVLSFGVTPKMMTIAKDVEKSVKKVMQALLKDKQVQKGDKLVFSAGVPLGRVGSTNTVMVRNVK